MLTCLALAASTLGAQGAQGAASPLGYTVLVASEATDQIHVVRFTPDGQAWTSRVERSLPVGINPIDPDGPHGIGVSPDRKFFYVSTAHGVPYGSLWKFDAVADTVAGHIELGNFPATLQVSPDGAYAYVVNFNLHGEMVPSSVSVVSTDPFVEVARITTCTMPHGSRLNPAGTRHYSACMMDDMLVEIDTRELKVSRHFMLAKGAEHGEAGPPHRMAAGAGGHDMGGHGMEAPKPGNVSCSPTWAQPSPDGRSVFVACNKTSDIVEVDATSWTMRRRIPAGDGVYNLGITHDGRLLIGTNKRGKSVSIIEVASGKELARIPTQRRIVTASPSRPTTATRSSPWKGWARSPARWR
jgi:DNA-binding beta-propeller fold protein YncE